MPIIYKHVQKQTLIICQRFFSSFLSSNNTNTRTYNIAYSGKVILADDPTCFNGFVAYKKKNIFNTKIDTME